MPKTKGCWMIFFCAVIALGQVPEEFEYQGELLREFGFAK